MVRRVLVCAKNHGQICVAARDWIEMFKVATFGEAGTKFRALDRLIGPRVNRDLKHGFSVAERAAQRNLLFLRSRRSRHKILREVGRYETAYVCDLSGRGGFSRRPACASAIRRL